MRKLALMLAGIALFSLSVLAQSTTITGKVVDSKTGLGLPGVPRVHKTTFRSPTQYTKGLTVRRATSQRQY